VRGERRTIQQSWSEYGLGDLYGGVPGKLLLLLSLEGSHFSQDEQVTVAWQVGCPVETFLFLPLEAVFSIPSCKNVVSSALPGLQVTIR
jgi:hypothetical protein